MTGNLLRGVVFCAVLPVAAGLAAEEQAEVPTADELQESRDLVEEVFGREVREAKSAEQRADVAREILAAAADESDPANKYAALQAAKRIAIEAGNGQLALEAMRQLVDAFEPAEPKPQGAWLAAADAAWDAAESRQGSEQLAGRVDAVECWLRAPASARAGLAGAKWRKRVGELEGGKATVAVKVDHAKPVDARTLKLLRAINGKAVTIVNKKSGLELHVSGGSGEPGATVTQWEPSREHTNGNWVVEVIDGRWCRFRNATSGLWLGRQEGSRSGIADSAIQSKITDEGNDWKLQLVDDSSVIFRHRHDGLCLGPWKGWARRGCGIHLYPFTENDPSLRWQFRAAR